MEVLVMDGSFWRGKRVFLTGHTGFKGSWLLLWLQAMGADVTGYALAAPSEPSLFGQARLSEIAHHVEGDIRDYHQLSRAMADAQPEIVFHLAAQSLVRLSYDQPIETYATNVMGTVHLLEAVRQTGGVKAVVAVTSDKCYENREWVWPYRETDPMGGHDPYSNSKGCSELVISAFRKSYFPPERIASGGVAVASVRAGNVIGGGDWALDRLVPDLVRAFLKGESPEIRSPLSVRPWQHVLEALGGYLMIAERLFEGDASMADGWNFGPSDDDAKPVNWIVDRMQSKWGGASDATLHQGHIPHEAGLLRLDCSKARNALGWKPSLGLERAIDWIVAWHQAVEEGQDARQLTRQQIAEYARLSGRHFLVGLAN